MIPDILWSPTMPVSPKVPIPNFYSALLRKYGPALEEAAMAEAIADLKTREAMGRS